MWRFVNCGLELGAPFNSTVRPRRTLNAASHWLGKASVVQSSLSLSSNGDKGEKTGLTANASEAEHSRLY